MRPALKATQPKVQGSVLSFTNRRHLSRALSGPADWLSATVLTGKILKRWKRPSSCFCMLAEGASTNETGLSGWNAEGGSGDEITKGLSGWNAEGGSANENALGHSGGNAANS